MRLLLALILFAMALPAHAAVEISNFKSGLACMGAKSPGDDRGWICQPTEQVLMTDQGTCTFDSKDYPCTWIGFEFDYRGAGAGSTLQCMSETSVPVTEGNPGKLLARQVQSQPFELALDKDSGHFFNPQYFAFSGRHKGEDRLVNTGHCESGGRRVFEYRFDIRFPTVDS